MAATDLLVVGPRARTTGGIARFLTEQQRRLPDDIAVRVYDNGARDTEHPWGVLHVALVSIVAMLAFPFRTRPDIVHVHTSHGLAFYRVSWYVLVAGVLWRRPVVVHVHGSSFDTFAASDSPLAAGTQRLTFGIADRVIALSASWRTVLARRVDRSKLVVVPNAVDPSAYEPCFDADPPVIAFVSNHIERKGIREFVTAIDRLAGADCRVRIAGAGPLSERAERLADRTPNVEYLGYVEEAQKRALLDEASVYVLPTYAEGLPIALLEGMAGGNAVVTTDVGAIPEVVDDESGWIVPPGDSDALTSALQAALADPAATAQMGRHNRSLVERHYAWPVVTEQLADLYRGLARPTDKVTATPQSAET